MTFVHNERCIGLQLNSEVPPMLLWQSTK